MRKALYTAIEPFLKFMAVPLGFVFFLLGCLGIVLPLIPHTPFFILTALLWGYGSRRLYRWLLGIPVVGESLYAWKHEGAIPLHAKVLSAIALLLGIAFAVGAGPWLWYKISVPLLLVIILIFIASRPRPISQRREIVSIWAAVVLWKKTHKFGFESV